MVFSTAPYAYVGEEVDLGVAVSPIGVSYTVEWDLDADGDFDDGTQTTPGGGGSARSAAHNLHTFTTPGVHAIRVRSRPRADPRGSSPTPSLSVPAARSSGRRC